MADHRSDDRTPPPTSDLEETPGPPARSGPVEPLGPGSRIGPYRLVRVLGQGGMGTVFLAEQSEPIRRQVALKLIRATASNPYLVHRFEAERQALARLDHPNIARVVEAGDTEDGHPYIVMELVEGEPISTWCDRHRVDVAGRLRLFISVCHAIHHAHQKGILHRDIKPSNVLVTRVGERPLAKVIDFGIAKALDEPLTDAGDLTREGVITGTPAYLSPELLSRQHGIDPDIRSDVYALGALLYQLLTGEAPFSDREGLVQLMVNVAEGNVPPPSRRVSGLDARTLDDRARDRACHPRTLVRQLGGDLDWITLKAMALAPDDRYSSASALAADLIRSTRNEPVQAGPPSTWYRARKLVRRHLVAALSLAVVAVALIGGIAARTLEAQRANREAERANREAAAARQAQAEAEEVVEFLVELFRVSDPGRSRGETITARELLDRGAERIADELADQPATRSRLLGTIGAVYSELGLYDPAEPLLRDALQQRRTLGEPLLVASSCQELAELHWLQGRYDEANELFGEALTLRERELGPDHLLVAETLNDLASSLRIQGRVDEAEALYRRALAIREAALGPDHLAVAESVHDLGVLCFDNGREAEARPLFERALAIRERELGQDHPAVAHSANGLAMVLATQGDLEGSEKLFRRTLEIRTAVLGADHADVGQSLNNLATVLLDLDRRGEASELIERAVAVYESSLGPDHYRVAIALHNLADLERESGRYDLAEAHYRRAASIFETALGADHLNVSYPLKGLGDLERDRGQPHEALPWYRRALLIRQSQLDEDHELVTEIVTEMEALSLRNR